MKSVSAFLIFSVAVCQVFDTHVSAVKLNRKSSIQVSVFFGSLALDHLNLYKQMVKVIEDPKLSNKVVFELVPFGKGNVTNDPWRINCEHGPEECYGNLMTACFLAKNPDQVKQVNFVSCMMNDVFPPHAGERCAHKLNISFEGVHKCIHSREGHDYLIKDGKRTLEFASNITKFPVVAFDNVYNAKDQEESFVNLKKVIIRKLKDSGIKGVELQISKVKLNVTIFYETLCPDCANFFNTQVSPAYEDVTIREKVYFELVPFGKAQYTENPWSITCQHGPEECYGNVMNACFMARHPDNYEQVTFVSCCMSADNPAYAGEDCADSLGYSYKGVEECTKDEEGIALQIKNGKRTLNFNPQIASVPTIVYNNVYNDQDQQDSLSDFKGVILRKLND